MTNADNNFEMGPVLSKTATAVSDVTDYKVTLWGNRGPEPYILWKGFSSDSLSLLLSNKTNSCRHSPLQLSLSFPLFSPCNN